MILYYTTSVGEDTIQTQTVLSIGGFRSNTVVPNNLYKNLFSDISCQSVKTCNNEFIALMLKNETGGLVSGATLFLDFPPDSQKDVEIALVIPNSSNAIERTSSPYVQPYHATFQSVDGIGNAVTLPDIADEGILGIWFKRIINKSVITDQYTDANLVENGNPVKADEDIGLEISWT
jgi:hypothetical protein